MFQLFKLFRKVFYVSIVFKIFHETWQYSRSVAFIKLFLNSRSKSPSFSGEPLLMILACALFARLYWTATPATDTFPEMIGHNIKEGTKKSDCLVTTTEILWCKKISTQCKMIVMIWEKVSHQISLWYDYLSTFENHYWKLTHVSLSNYSPFV